MHEFIAFCRLLGAEPDLTINSGYRRRRSAAEQVEYCNGSIETRLGKLRAQNGSPEPFNVRLWTIGNEMYGPWQAGHMSLNQYWVKHNDFVEAMRKVDPKIKVTLSGASVCERGIGCAEKKGNFFPSEWEPPMPYDLPFAFGSHEDWDGWLLANCADNVDYVSEHTYAYPGLAYDTTEADRSWMSRIRCRPRRGGCPTVREKPLKRGQKYLERMPQLKEKNIKFIFDEWGCRNRGMSGSYQPPGMLTPLSSALFLNEVFRHSDMVGASCATGGLGTVLIDSAGDATGFSAEGLVMKLMATHFANALPVSVSGNSPQQAVPGTAFVDIPTVPIGSPTYPLDVTAALSGDRKKLLFSVVNPTEEKHEFTPTGCRGQAARAGQAVADCAARLEFGESSGAKACGGNRGISGDRACGDRWLLRRSASASTNSRSRRNCPRTS